MRVWDLNGVSERLERFGDDPNSRLYRSTVAGKHGSRPWRELGWSRGTVVVAGSVVMAIVNFFRTAPEWLVGLILMALVVSLALVFLVPTP